MRTGQNLELLSKKRLKLKRIALNKHNDNHHFKNKSEIKGNSELIINLDIKSGTILKSKKRSLKIKDKKDKLRSLMMDYHFDWNSEERQKLLDSILKYTNDLNNVGEKNIVKFSSSTRHQTQKLLVKLKKKSIFDFNIDLGKSTAKKLSNIGKTLNSDFYLKTIKNLKFVAFERKSAELIQASSPEIFYRIQNKNFRDFEETLRNRDQYKSKIGLNENMSISLQKK